MFSFGSNGSKYIKVDSKSEYKQIVSMMDKENQDIKHLLCEISPAATRGAQRDNYDNWNDKDGTSTILLHKIKHPP